MRKIFVASPGTGKTTTLLNMVGQLLAAGVHPAKICFTTFTRHAAEDAVNKAVTAFGLTHKDFPYFRTLHSLAYRALVSPALVENNREFYKELYTYTGVPVSFLQSNMSINPDRAVTFLGDLFLNIYSLARNKQLDPRIVMQMYSQFTRVDFYAYTQFIKKYNELKERIELIDYTDMIAIFLREKINVPVDYLFVDEYQDLTTLQNAMVNKIEQQGGVETVIAGDDKQSIYSFSGGDPKQLIDMVGERVVLNQSYRLKFNILQFSEKIAARIKNKTPYAIKPVAEGGKVEFIQSLRQLDLANGTWLLLARLNANLDEYKVLCDEFGYKYIDDTNNNAPAFAAIKVWESLRSGEWLTVDEFKLVLPFLESGTQIKHGAKKQIEMDDKPESKINMGMLGMLYGVNSKESWYYTFKMPSYQKEIVRRMTQKEGPTSNPRIRISTIHGAKGLEAEKVCIIPQLSPSCQETLKNSPDDEHRVMYVAVTRAKDWLYVVFPLRYYYKKYPMGDAHAYAQLTRFAPASVQRLMDSRGGTSLETHEGPMTDEQIRAKIAKYWDRRF